MQFPNPLRSNLALFAIVAVAGTQNASGQESLRCVSISSIDRTEVLDDRTIAFYLARDRIYLNRLNRQCPNLDRDRAFSYSTPTGQLCALDAITVIEDFGGFSRGASCALGEFDPTDEETLAVMRGELQQLDIQPEEIEVEEAEAERSEGDASGGEESDGRDDEPRERDGEGAVP